MCRNWVLAHAAPLPPTFTIIEVRACGKAAKEAKETESEGGREEKKKGEKKVQTCAAHGAYTLAAVSRTRRVTPKWLCLCLCLWDAKQKLMNTEWQLRAREGHSLSYSQKSGCETSEPRTLNLMLV